MVIVDTTVWIDYLGTVDNAQTAWLDRNLGEVVFGLTDQILCGVLQGIRDDTIFEKVRHTLTGFEIFDTGGAEHAIATSRNYRHLRSRGITVPKTIDCFIATFCISGGHSLLHRDRDFDPFEQHLGLHVIHPEPHHPKAIN